MLKCSNLAVGYKKTVLSSLNFEIKRGEVTAILGPNGAGKTTLLKTLAAILKPVSGVVYLDGKKVYEMNRLELAKKLSVTTTERIDAGYMTGFEVVALGRYPYTDALGRLSDRDVEIVNECLKLVNALELSDKPFSQMSDGEKQKIMIARALAQEPEIMLLDEPTSFLDVNHKVEIMLLLRRIAEKTAVFFTTHDVELALRICDRVLLVSQGKILKQGSPEKVLKDELVREVYGIEKAKFNELTGAFELFCSGKSNLHVVCGGGSGVRVMRLLSKMGIPFTAGVLHCGDVDCCVAQSSAVKCVTEKAFSSIKEETIKTALKLAKGVVVDTAFPIGEINEKNVQLFEVAEKVISFRKKEEFRELVDRDAIFVDFDDFRLLLKKSLRHL